MIASVFVTLLADPLRLRSSLSVILVALAAASVRLGGGSTSLAMTLAGLSIALALWRAPIKDTKRNRRGWTFVIFVALVLSIWRALALEELLDTGTDFLLLLCVQRFFNRQKTREHQQIILITGVLMTIGAVINVELSYPLILTIYLATLVFALTINLLVAEAERLGPRVMYDLQRIDPRRVQGLFSISIQVTGLVLIGGLAVFLLFPRFGAGVFLRGALPTGTVSGFSSQVQLGRFGTIKNDPTVVMRITPDRATQAGDFLGWYFRGTSFDRYEDGEWSASLDQPSLSLSYRCNTHILGDGDSPRMSPMVPGVGCRDRLSPRDGRQNGERPIVSTITLEDIGLNLLFLPDIPAGVRLQSRGLVERSYRPQLGVGDKLTVKRKQPGPMRYKAISRLGFPSDLELASVPVLTQSVPEHFLVVPANFTPQFRELAVSLKQDGMSRVKAVRAVIDHLAALEYTLEQPEMPSEDPRDPLEFFLFDARAGHCEYFATAAAMLLREMGIPTRLVNGYVGGTLNEYGGFYTVTQADAHSWIEVYFDRFGWLRFDPTPTDGRRSQSYAIAFPKLREYLDALRNKYLAYVIDYNLRTQLDLLSSVGVQWHDQRFRVNRTRLTTVAVISAMVALFVVWLRLRRRGSFAVRDVTKSMQGVMNSFARHGFERAAAETPHALARRISAAGFPAEEGLETFISEYERLRFAYADDATPPDASALELRARRLRRAARKWNPTP